ncbi:MAG: hypothetical protein O6952_02490, partial [Planctomycetota bacterium]|nr:hypothetical protein [Planctomycetota bacterium]
WLFWIRAIEKGGWIWFILSGLAHAFAFYAYSTGRAVAPLHLMILVLTFRGHGPAGWVRAGAAAAFVVALLPALIWSMANPGSLGSRFADVSVLAEADPFRAGLRFVLNLIRYVSPGFLFTDGDPILRHHSGTGGVLYLFLIPGLVFGILSAIRRGSDPRLRSIFYICLLFPLVPSLTHRSFHLLRSIHAAPFFVLLAVIGSRELFSGRAGEERAPGGKRAWLLVLVLASAGLEAPTYVYELFKKYPARAEIFFQAHVGEVIEAVRAGHDGPIYYDPTVFRDESGKSNRPEIHFLFWGGLDPETYHEGGIEEFDIRRWTRGTVVDPGSRVILGEGREEADWSLTGSFPLAKGTGRQARIYQVPQE